MHFNGEHVKQLQKDTLGTMLDYSEAPALEVKYHFWPFLKIQFDSRPVRSKECEA